MPRLIWRVMSLIYGMGWWLITRSMEMQMMSLGMAIMGQTTEQSLQRIALPLRTLPIRSMARVLILIVGQTFFWALHSINLLYLLGSSRQALEPLFRITMRQVAVIAYLVLA